MKFEPRIYPLEAPLEYVENGKSKVVKKLEFPKHMRWKHIKNVEFNEEKPRQFVFEVLENLTGIEAAIFDDEIGLDDLKVLSRMLIKKFYDFLEAGEDSQKSSTTNSECPPNTSTT